MTSCSSEKMYFILSSGVGEWWLLKFSRSSGFVKEVAQKFSKSHPATPSLRVFVRGSRIMAWHFSASQLSLVGRRVGFEKLKYSVHRVLIDEKNLIVTGSDIINS